MYCTLEGREFEVDKSKEMLGHGDKETENLIESAIDLFTRERMSKSISPRRVKMYPDEYPFTVGADSSEYFIKQLGLKQIEDSFIANKQQFIDLLQTEDPQEAKIKLNDIFRDKLFNVTKCGDEYIISFETKPTTKFKERREIQETKVSPKTILNIMNRLVDYHGITFNFVSNYELQKMGEVNVKDVKGFIKDGQIFINSDNCTIDTKIHELMHLFLGGIKFVDPKLYYDSLKIIQQDPVIQTKMEEFVNRSDTDALEEIFVEEYSKYLVGEESYINNLSEDIKYDLNYNIRRMLDTMFMGDFSNKIIPDNVLPHLTMLRIGQIVNSEYIYPQYHITSMLHRKQQNLKEEWFKSGKLIKEC